MTLSAVVSATGITAPSYADILTALREQFRAIYGSDVYIDPDSQDGQLLALLALAISDSNNTAIAVYNSFSPATAVGAGLSSNVKINGIARLIASRSTAVGLVVGTVGTVITNGTVKDTNGNIWNLPASVLIPPAGQISVTVTAASLGAIVAPTGLINIINTPTIGWQSFVSTSAATPGAPVESDAALRQRQAVSTSLPAQTPLAAMLGALLNLPGVTRAVVYENATNTTDANGLPPRSISVVIAGGDLGAIAQTIGQKKTPGAATFGTSSRAYTDPVTGIAYNIMFFVLVPTTIKVNIVGKALAGYSSTTIAAIQNSIAAYLNGLSIGSKVEYTRLWAPGYLNGAAAGQTYEIDTLTVAAGAGPLGTSDVIVPFNSAAACNPLFDVTVTIT
jgi:uncharacterized phage protein gp47/JayE